MIFTSFALSEKGLDSNLRLYKKLSEMDVRIILILRQKPEFEVPESNLFIVEGDANGLLVDRASIAWFANKWGEIVFINRADLYGTDVNGPLMIEYFKSQH